MSADNANDNCGCTSCGCDSHGEKASTDEDDSFHPLGEEWEAQMEEMLDDVEYDTELGLQMAEDAQRLVAGEMTEEEFYDKHHDAVVEEFEEDSRPMVEAIEEMDTSTSDKLLDRLRNADPDDDMPRREMMKKMGLGAGAVGLAGLVGFGDDDDEAPTRGVPEGTSPDSYGATEPTGDKQYGMVIDLERCDGCLLCVAGCIEENNTSTGANWMYVLTYEDENTEQENFLVRPCQHCTNAPCEKVCPVRARHTRAEDGLVLTDYEICIGCRYCQVACPYGVNYFQWGDPDTPQDEIMQADVAGPEELRAMDPEERKQTLRDANDHMYDDRGRWVDSRPPQGVMGKCTFCPSRQDGNQGDDMVGTVACMDACDAAGMSVIHFGDLNDPDSRPNRYLERRAEQEFEQGTEFDEPEDESETTVTPWGKLSAFKLLEDMGTDPNVIYLGNEPGSNAEQVEGPVTYEDIGVTDRRKDHLDQFPGSTWSTSAEGDD